MSGWGWTRPQRDLGLRHRLIVVVPGSALGIVDSLVAIVTLGYIQPGMQLNWMFKVYKNRK